MANNSNRSSRQIVKFTNFEPTKLTISTIKENKMGSRDVIFKYDSKPFYLSMYDVFLPFGASAKPEEYRKGDKDQWSLQCQLTEEMQTKFEQMDNHIVDLAFKSEEFMSALGLTAKQRTREVIESKFYNTIKLSKKKEGSPVYPPTIRINISNDDSTDGFRCEFFSTTKQLMNIDNVSNSETHISRHFTKGTVCSVLVRFSGWISKVGCGISLKAQQVIVDQSSVQPTRGICMLDGVSDLSEPRVDLQTSLKNLMVANDPVDLDDLELKPTDLLNQDQETQLFPDLDNPEVDLDNLEEEEVEEEVTDTVVNLSESTPVKPESKQTGGVKLDLKPENTTKSNSRKKI